MTTPADLLAAMTHASRDLQARIDEHPGLVERECDAERLASLSEATAYLASSGTVAERQAHVVKACADERYRANLAKGLTNSNKLAINAAMSRLSALQSQASAMREEMRLARVGTDGP